ncbi:MAG: hypothetical protein ABSB63_04475 [Spirochaetia bacterium]|jgi:hypothetical protein
MSSRAVISIMLILVSLGASAADWGTLAADSDRTLDPALLSALRNEDFDTKVLICAGVGKRADPYAGDIIASLMATRAVKTSDTVELLLRTLLQGLFDPSRGESWISDRIEANRDVLDSMAGRMAEWRDPQLAGALVRIIPSLHTPRALPALAQAGSRVVRALERGSGAMLPQELALALDFLSAVEKTRRPDFLAQCTDIARLSREKFIVDRARAVAQEIAAQNPRSTAAP